MKRDALLARLIEFGLDETTETVLRYKDHGPAQDAEKQEATAAEGGQGKVIDMVRFFREKRAALLDRPR